MTTTFAPATPNPVRPVSFGRVLGSEWIKLRTVRATVWTLSITVLVMAGLAALTGWSTVLMRDSDIEVDAILLDMHPASIVNGGWFFAQLVVIILGVLTVTGEYATGMIRSTFAAVPRRSPALLGKAAVLFATVFVTSAVAVALSWLVSLPFLGQLDISVDFASAETWRLLGGTALYLATMSVLAFAVGALVRHSAGAIAIVIGLVLVIETVLASIPLRIFELVSPFLPSSAGGRLLMDEVSLSFVSNPDAPVLTPWQGYAVLVGWVVLLLGSALLVTRRRDA